MDKLVDRLKALDTASLIGIDGMCASGKTTLASYLAQELGFQVVHMDDFYVPMAQRPAGWQQLPEGNADYGRILEEVILPFKAGRVSSYRPFDCKTQNLREPVTVSPHLTLIIEGTYSCHPKLREYYDLRLFMIVSPALRSQRLLDRGGQEALEAFNRLWIPMEELYFAKYSPQSCCNTVSTEQMEEQ